MSKPGDAVADRNIGMIRMLTYLMFTMFAMTTDSVGAIIPEIIRTFGLGMAAAGSFHYATMTGIALGGVGLGFVADRLGRKPAIIVGLSVFAVASGLFAVTGSFDVFLVLLFVSGLAVGLFKSAALALIGDISTSTAQHTRTMNLLEGFFGVGAIAGPAIVAALLAGGASWKYLYVIAAGLCAILIAVAASVRYPARRRVERSAFDGAQTLALLRNPYLLAFSAAIMLYVGIETAVYVWMPTLLAGYDGPGAAFAGYALAIFFGLRAAGRFLGAWMLSRFRWTAMLAVCSGAILVCFVLAFVGGRTAALVFLPLSGLFMSMIYPTLNSKGISCFPRSQHGGVAGIILFFTCVSAVAAPLAVGLIGDAFGDAIYGFGLATVFALLLAAGSIYNLLADPARDLLAQREAEYKA